MNPRIGITQRVEVVPGYGERRDCLDQSWFPLLEWLNLVPVPLPNSLNDPLEYLEQANLNGYILTGGNDLIGLPDAVNPAPERDNLERLILDIALDRQLPVLGICRGLQMINTYFGGQLVKMEGHVAIRHRITPVPSNGLVQKGVGIVSKEVNSFHTWGVSNSGLGKDLYSLAVSDGAEIEAICHESLPLLGLMWHPEREMPRCTHDMRIIKTLFGA